MKKYLVIMLVLLLCFSFILPASARTLSSEKQTLINKISLDLADLQNQLSQTASGSVQYKVDQLNGGFLMMVPELADILGSKLGFDYKVNTPAKQMGFKWNLTYKGKVYQGDVYLSGSKIIFTRDIVQLIKELAPTADIPEPATLPQYLFLDEPELANLWSNMLVTSQIHKVIPQLNDLLTFFIEGIPDTCLSTSNNQITLRLDHKQLVDAITFILEKIQKEPERFAAAMAGIITTVDPTQSFDQVKAELLSDIQQGIKNGEFSGAEEFDQYLAESGLELESLSFVTSKNMNGPSSFNLNLKIKDETVFQGKLTVTIDQNRSGDRIEGKLNMDLKATIKENNMDVGAKLTGTYSQSKTTAASDLMLTVSAYQNGMPLMNLDLNMLSKAAVDPNVQVNIPTLTPQNSRDLNALMEEEKPRQKSLAIFPGMEQRVSVVLNGKPLDFDVQPFVKDGRTMVPVRNLAEALGCRVTYMNGNEVLISKGDKYLMMKIGERRYKVNGVAKTLDVPACVKNGRTLVPIRFVAEELGCGVKAAGDTVFITSNPLF